MQDTTLSVSELLAIINQTLDFAYPSVVVEGEVASFKVSREKYIFFDLKDNEAALGCFMMAFQLKTIIQDGMKVRIVAQPRLTPWGKFSLTVRDIRPVGEGSIKQSGELLKTKLAQEGLFDSSRKRALPDMPVRVGLIASVESAGYADFIKIIGARWGGLEITVANVQVQGEGAGEQILRALQFFNQLAEPVEVVVVIRGGGSAEDLAVFNEEPVVRAVAGSRTPTLVGVGHETDTSLCDLAADVRAATPSNAAQLLVPDRLSIWHQIQQQLNNTSTHFLQRLKVQSVALSTTPEKMFEKIQQNIAIQNQQIAHRLQLLEQLDPKKALRRGYSLIRDPSGKLLRAGGADVRAGDLLTVELERAILNVGVTNVDIY
ncbi:MAG TPA: exodeoxyribonuclease VII large subunit [Candidatus Acidoferrum sp.]|nr:exodeoxyribonuclease VII large subunit [Candidatus Acidoferrum sp.]